MPSAHKISSLRWWLDLSFGFSAMEYAKVWILGSDLKATSAGREGAELQPAFLSSFCTHLCDCRVVTKPVQISPLLKSHTSSFLLNPLKAVYCGAKCLVRSDLVPFILSYPPYLQSLDYTIKFCSFAFQSLSPSSRCKQHAELQTWTTQNFSNANKMRVCQMENVWRWFLFGVTALQLKTLSRFFIVLTLLDPHPQLVTINWFVPQLS